MAETSGSSTRLVGWICPNAGRAYTAATNRDEGPDAIRQTYTHRSTFLIPTADVIDYAGSVQVLEFVRRQILGWLDAIQISPAQRFEVVFCLDHRLPKRQLRRVDFQKHI